MQAGGCQGCKRRLVCMSAQPARPLRRSVGLVLGTLAAGLTIRFAPLGMPAVVVKYGGSMLWALMIYWIVSTLLPACRVYTSALVTAGLVTLVELLKLHHSPALDAFRLTLPGILLLGRIFSLRDIGAYWLAILIGMLIDRRIRSRALNTERES